jgi:hypothetical protein
MGIEDWQDSLQYFRLMELPATAVMYLLQLFVKTTTPTSQKGCQVKIVSLSCAKDEGLCRTFDLIQGE